jgi:queuine tRNA-ribosyltransferase
MFKLLKKSKLSSARLGWLKTAHGSIPTPFFMPVATQGAVKQVSTEEMRGLKAPVLLSNTYHLMLRPGEKAVKKAGGLHRFMDWNGPILTDSGGFQVFSLAGNKNRVGALRAMPQTGGDKLVKLTDQGVRFRSYVDGREFFLTPEKSLKIQLELGVDIAVCLDECVALPAQRKYLERSVELTTDWAKRTVGALHATPLRTRPLLFAVIQGGLDKRLRLKSLADLDSIGFDGFNIGGLSVGETPSEMYKVLDYLTPAMPADKPRYLMGVGYPENIVEAVRRGVDMFDCVIPTREGRHGRIFSYRKKSGISNFQFPISNEFYNVININNSKFAKSDDKINSNSRLPELRNYSLGYLHYLFKIKEPLGQRLASLNNLEFYIRLMENIREGIKNEKF